MPRPQSTEAEVALFNACEMAGVEHRMFKIREILAELGEQGFSVVPRPPVDALLAMPKGGQPTLFQFTDPDEYATRVAALKERIRPLGERP